MTALELPDLAVVGPGRSGQALARRMADGGVDVVGFLGRTVQSAGAAVRFAGVGRVLDPTDLREVGAVLLAVQDDRLEATAGALAPHAAEGQLWFHVSGAHDLSVLDPLRDAGVRCGSLHPLCPIPDPKKGYDALPDTLAVVQADLLDGDATGRTIEAFARAASLRPLTMAGGDRLLYHAACVLSANGLTALYSLVEDLFARALPDADPVDIAKVPEALMGGALAACATNGAQAALSGPVTRGDADLVRRQYRALSQLEPPHTGAFAAAVFRDLMRRATMMAEQSGVLSDDALAAMHKALTYMVPAHGES